MKPVEFLGDSLHRLREFPDGPRREAGFQIDRVQQGLDPHDWKPLSTVGLGVQEIRARDESGAFRVVYIARFEEAVYVLHAFRKTSPRTARTDIQLARARYSDLMKVRSGKR